MTGPGAPDRRAWGKAAEMKRKGSSDPARGYRAGVSRVSPVALADLFPRARLWRRWMARSSGLVLQVRDPVLATLSPPSSERLLQAVWYDERWRPKDLRTAEGEVVRVGSPGRWNLEAGPDFLGATLEIGPQRRRMQCDVEIHLRPADWDAHGHAADPRYRNVRAHVTYAPGRGPETLPAAALRIALRDALAAIPGFSFECIDTTAYPHAVRQAPCPCAAVLDGWTVTERSALLEAAGEERLRRKAARLVPAIEERGVEQVLYEEVLGALGYRDNKVPFRRLAEQLPLATLRALAGEQEGAAYACLAGVAGLLPESPSPAWDAETRRWVRSLWDIWWRQRADWAGRGLSREDWKRSGFRPANHPLRRLAAAARLFSRSRSLGEQIREALRLPADGLERICDQLDVPPDGYWANRLSLGGAVQARPAALVGRSRAAAILFNAVLPVLAATGSPAVFRPGWAEALPEEDANRSVRQTAGILFGPDVPPSLIRPAIRRQGLLQIFQDFCLPDRSACRDCPFPDHLREGRAEFCLRGDGCGV